MTTCGDNGEHVMGVSSVRALVREVCWVGIPVLSLISGYCCNRLDANVCTGISTLDHLHRREDKQE